MLYLARASTNNKHNMQGAHSVAHQTTRISGLDIFYREAGLEDAPVILLPHGLPTSSHMFRNLIPTLADEFHLVAPGYPGFGNSSMPTVTEFEYTFENLATLMDEFNVQLGLNMYSLYAQDDGTPISYRHKRGPQDFKVRLPNTGHFAFEECYTPMAELIRTVLRMNIKPQRNVGHH